jgi:hypothetical protein
MKTNKILVKGRVDQKLKKDFLIAWRRFNQLEVRKGRKPISQAKFMGILVAESVNDGKRNPARKAIVRPVKRPSQSLRSDGRP